MLLLGLTSGEGQEGTRKEREGEGEERERRKVEVIGMKSVTRT